MKNLQNSILADGRWQGRHGIGRFSAEVLARLHGVDILDHGPRPLSLRGLFWLRRTLAADSRHKVYFSPGFNPVWSPRMPYVFTIHDLTHLQLSGAAGLSKKFYYEILIKPSAKHARHILTVSEYSRARILEWTGLPEEKVTVVGNGISAEFSPEGRRFDPGYPYLFYVGNMKTHKNVTRLMQAFAQAKNINQDVRLVCANALSPEIKVLLERLGLSERVHACGGLNDQEMADYYRGALAVVFPSLYEGFGLPVVEGMASGVPVLTSSTSSLPEVAGDAALLVDPRSVDSIAAGLERIVTDSALRSQLIQNGLSRCRLFSWDRTAQRVQQVLDSFS